MRVLTIISKLEMGGIEKTLLSCLPYLIENGVQMSILCTLGGALDEDYRKLGVELIDFGKHKKPFKDARFLKKILKTRKFDVVHSRYGHTSGWFSKVCHDLNIPFVVSIHNERAMFRNSWIDKPLLGFFRTSYLGYHKNMTLKYATRIVGHSKANLRYFTSKVDNLMIDSQFQVLYNGVDFSKFKNYPELDSVKKTTFDTFVVNKSKVLIHIGSFKEQKNHLFLINTFNNLKPKENNYGLILLGVGELMNVTQEYVNKLDLANHVLFVGMEENIAPYLYHSDLFIFPSLYEGFGNVLIEAQYANLPIAAADIEPHYESVYEGYHSYFYSPNNEEAAIKNINILLTQDNAALIKEAKVFSESFSIENMSNNLIKTFHSLI